MKTIFSIPIFLLALSSCTIAQTNAPFSLGKKKAKTDNKKIDEISGIEPVKGRSKFLVHNDSGDKPRIYELDEDLEIDRTIKFKNVEKVRDCEDITQAMIGGENYIFVGDIGDNDAKYQQYSIYWFEYNKKKEEVKVRTIIYQYEDGARDAETMFYDSRSSNLYIVTKREDKSRLYEISFSTDKKVQNVTAKYIGELPFRMATAGDLSNDGTELLVKNYNHIYYWKLENSQPLTSIISQQPKKLLYSPEPQGEAIAWSNKMHGYFTISEKRLGKNPKLYFYSRK